MTNPLAWLGPTVKSIVLVHVGSCLGRDLLSCLFLLAQLTMAERYRDLLTISTVHTLNAALCRWHMKRCPPSRQLLQLCGRAMRGYKRLRTAIKTMDREMDCIYRLVSRDRLACFRTR